MSHIVGSGVVLIAAALILITVEIAAGFVRRRRAVRAMDREAPAWRDM